VALGATAVLRLGDGIDVVTTSTRMHTIDLQVFLSQGIDPLGRNVLVVKSSQHFCAAFEPIAREVMLVDAGGLCSTDASRFTYAKLRRPIWPLDPYD
jgi:microcystin degradation protein MlrC